jgi:hypothetical protein
MAAQSNLTGMRRFDPIEPMMPLSRTRHHGGGMGGCGQRSVASGEADDAQRDCVD